MKVLITQSMLFPWVGMLEQIRLADVIVHYDDVQFSKGSFTNRVQVKTSNGFHWMTIPIQGLKLGTPIDQVKISASSDWRSSHFSLLKQSFKGSPFKSDALGIVERVYSSEHICVSTLARESMLSVADYYGLLEDKLVLDIRSLGVAGSSSSRVLEIVKKVGGKVYITGHGARNYLDHKAFEDSGISVEYMNYRLNHYPQPWGEFTPYVSSLDLVANMGKDGIDKISSDTLPWHRFVDFN